MKLVEAITHSMVVLGGILFLVSQYRALPQDDGAEPRKPQGYMKLIGFALVIAGGLKLLGALV